MRAKRLAFNAASIPDWCLRRPKPFHQAVCDFLAAPVRMALLPDAANERLHLTSLRAERFAAVLPHLQGRVLDVGAGDNALIKLYRAKAGALGVQVEDAKGSVGVDVQDWDGGCQIIEDAASLPFADDSFDTVCFIACINHIPNREPALREARRVLRPDGHVLVTMINKFLGTVGHAIWWYSEDKHRDVDEAELMGIDRAGVIELLAAGGFPEVDVHRFAYGLNRIYRARSH